jgi:hypothetical protein
MPLSSTVEISYLGLFDRMCNFRQRTNLGYIDKIAFLESDLLLWLVA